MTVPVDRIVAALQHAGLLVETTESSPSRSPTSRTTAARRLRGSSSPCAARSATATTSLAGEIRGRRRRDRRGPAHDAALARRERRAPRGRDRRRGRVRGSGDAAALVGVTGTNGKTTTVGMLRHLLDEPDARSASIGTLGVLIGSEGAPVARGAALTTPGPIELQRVLRALVDRGVRTVAMEVSSHALDQRRVEACRSTPACSRTSRATISTITARWRRTSPPRRSSYRSSAARRGGRQIDDEIWQHLPPATRWSPSAGIRRRWCARTRCSFVRAAASGSSWRTTSGTRCSFRSSATST